MTAWAVKAADFELRVREDIDAILYSTNDTSVVAKRLGFASAGSMFRRLHRAGMADVAARINEAGARQRDQLMLLAHSAQRGVWL